MDCEGVSEEPGNYEMIKSVIGGRRRYKMSSIQFCFSENQMDTNTQNVG